MFVSVDDTDDKYETEVFVKFADISKKEWIQCMEDIRIRRAYERPTRNFFELQRYNSRIKWHSILDEDNSKVFEVELTQTLVNVNRLITKIEVESSMLTEPTELKNENEKKFKDYLAMGRELITKLKVLATLEKASAMEKYEQSHVRKLSYAATEDTASGFDTESVMDGHGTFSRDSSFDRKDSRTITLVHKYAASFTGHYEMLDKLNHDVEEIVDRFNQILDNIHKQLQLRSGVILRVEENFIPEGKSKIHPTRKRSSFDSVDSERDAQFAPTDDLKLAVDMLTEHLQKSPLVAVYQHISTSGTGHLVEHTYSCSIAGLRSEGKSRKKIKAKEEAAMRMIKEIIEKQQCDNLPPQIVPFADYQIQELSALLAEREDVIDKLEEKCLQSHEPPPLYTILSETGKSNEPYFTVKCEAMGYTAVGHGFAKLQAKKNAAKSILNLVKL